MKIEVYIATHKDYNFPDIEGYIPIHVGKALTDLDLRIIGDNTGDNISELNQNFCELTALYWMWKNSDADILGLVHYRRYFLKKGCLDDLTSVDKGVVYLAKKEKYYVGCKFKILGKRFLKEYQSVKTQYSECHYKKDWYKTQEIIDKLHPEYNQSFLDVSKDKNGISHYNMFVASKEFLNNYSSWLFSILFALSKEIDISKYDNYQKRIYGFLSERLLNVYIRNHRKELKIEYLDVEMK